MLCRGRSTKDIPSAALSLDKLSFLFLPVLYTHIFSLSASLCRCTHPLCFYLAKGLG